MGKLAVVIFFVLTSSIPASAINVSSAVQHLLAAVDEDQPDLQRNFKKYFCVKGRAFNGLACNNETIAATVLAVCKDAEFKTTQCIANAKTKLKISDDAKIAESAKRVLKEQVERHDQILEKLCPYLPDDVAEYACELADTHDADDEADEPEEE